MTHYALLSVSDKTNILEVAKALTDRGIKLLSTGGTYQTIEDKFVEKFLEEGEKNK